MTTTIFLVNILYSPPARSKGLMLSLSNYRKSLQLFCIIIFLSLLSVFRQAAIGFYTSHNNYHLFSSCFIVYLSVDSYTCKRILCKITCGKYFQHFINKDLIGEFRIGFTSFLFLTTGLTW